MVTVMDLDCSLVNLMDSNYLTKKTPVMLKAESQTPQKQAREDMKGCESRQRKKP